MIISENPKNHCLFNQKLNKNYNYLLKNGENLGGGRERFIDQKFGVKIVRSKITSKLKSAKQLSTKHSLFYLNISFFGNYLLKSAKN